MRIITLPADVRFFPKEGPIHGILAAPPCDHLSRAGAHLWTKKGPGPLLESLTVVDACLRIIFIHQPLAWWALENPIGRIKEYLGEPAFKFDPRDYGDPWTKRTWLWGDFNLPSQRVAGKVPEELQGRGMGSHGRDRTTRMSSSWKVQRSMTPPGFAQAFFEANP